MQLLRQEIRNFIKSCEGIQVLLVRGAMLKKDEIEIIRLCSVELAINLTRCKDTA